MTFSATSSPRVVVDTNIIVSAALMPSLPRRAVEWTIAHGVLLVSPDLAAEWLEVLRRPKFQRYITDEEAQEFIGTLLTSSEWTVPTTYLSICRDMKDNMVLALALDAHADVVISGDEDLLVLSPFRDIPIVRPDAFLVRIGA